MNPTSNHCYIPFVDGLRAIAVLMVVAFHAGLGFSGGFIGVDVFFVISGFLITLLIERDLTAGTFSYRAFWMRRIRRILPASLSVTLLTLCLGTLILLPDELTRLAESAMATLAMAANVYFWRNVGYFSTHADVQPLLHMWSLAVEEQFYLFFPVVLTLLHRRLSQPAKFRLLLGCVISSMLLSEWAVRHQPGVAYFLLPSRAWELLLGSLLCYLPVPELSPRLRNIISASMMMAIAMAAGHFSEVTAFPGLSALWPCLATAILIQCNRSSESRVARWLGMPSIVTIGKMSYSIYLVHWPILALMRQYPGVAAETLPNRLLALILTAVASTMLYSGIETPLRSRRFPACSKRMLMGIAAIMLITTVSSIVVVRSNGLPSRFPPEVVRYAAAAKSFSHGAETTIDDIRNNKLPQLGIADGKVSCLLWGDSHAMALGPGLDASLKSFGLCGIQATHSETPPLLNFVSTTEYGLDEATPEYAAALMELVDRERIDFVVMAAMWSKYQNHPHFRESLADTVLRLQAMGIRTAIVHDVAHPQVDVPVRLAQAVRSSESLMNIGVDHETHRARHEVFTRAASALAFDGVTELFPDQHFVDQQGLWRAELDGTALYRDSDHLSIEGSVRLQPMFDAWLIECGGRLRDTQADSARP
ncbi:MAG: acyltransferase family protein [Planctomycetota bacterium]